MNTDKITRFPVCEVLFLAMKHKEIRYLSGHEAFTQPLSETSKG